MVSLQRRSSGFTLIELMVTIVVMVLLMLVAAPFASGWIDSTRQMRARSNLVESLGQARALAMRNPLELTALQATEGAAAVVWDDAGHALYVVSRTADGGAWELHSAGKQKWQGKVANPGSLALKAGTAADATDFTCAAFDTRGRLVDSNYGGAACVAPSDSAARIHVHVGSQEAVDVALL